MDRNVLSFDSIKSYVSDNFIKDINLSNNAHTVEAWLYVNQLPTKQSCPLLLGGADTGKHQWLLNNDGTMQIGAWSGNPIKPSIEINQWTHIAASYDGANLRVYMNGVLVDSQAGSFDLEASKNIKKTGNDKEGKQKKAGKIGLVLGKAQQKGDDHFNGRIKEVRIWNRARTQDEIQINMYSHLAGTEEGLHVYWRMNEGDGNKIQDFAGINDKATIHHGQWVEDDSLVLNPVEHVALGFDGVDDYVSVNTIKSLKTKKSTHTIEAWMYVDQLPVKRSCPLLLGGTGAGNHHWLLNNDGTMQIGVWSGGQINPSIETAQWTHIAASYDGTTLWVYTNGVLVDSEVVSFDLQGKSLVLGKAQQIGNNVCRQDDDDDDDHDKRQKGKNYSDDKWKKAQTDDQQTVENYFSGRIKEVRIWNRARTQDEIRADMYYGLWGTEKGLLGYWRMDKDVAGKMDDDHNDNGHRRKIDDLAGGSDNATIHGAQWLKDNSLALNPARYGALGFDGKNDHVSVTTIRGLNTGNSTHTIEAWLYVNQLPAKHKCSWPLLLGVFPQHDHDDDDNDEHKHKGHSKHHHLKKTDAGSHHWLLNNDGTMQIGALHGGHIQSSIETRQWTHIAASYDGTTLWVYLNGVLVDSQAVSFDLPGNTLILGEAQQKGGTHFRGSMKEVRVWNKARTQDEIRADMYTYLVGTEKGLLGYWRMNEIREQVLHDYSTGNDHEIQKKEITWVKDSNLMLKPAKHAVLQFDGVDDYLSINAINGLLPENSIHTIEAWLYPDQLPDQRSWILLLGSTGKGAHHWKLNHQGNLQIGIWGGNQVVTPLPEKQWSHIAVSYDGKKLDVYINGSLAGSTPAAFNLQETSLLLGKAQVGDNYFNGFSGKIKEFRIWNKARTQIQIQTAMYHRLLGTEIGLITYWPLNESINQLPGDHSANGGNHHYALHNGARWIEDNSLVLNKVKNAVLSFDGIDDYIDYGAIDFARGNYTVETWIRSDGGAGPVFAATNSPPGILIEMTPEGQIQFLHNPPESEESSEIYSGLETTFNDGQWHHLAVVKDGDNTFLYVDGILQGTQEGAQDFLQSLNVTQGTLTTETEQTYFEGQMTDLRIWDVARTEAQIQSFMFTILDAEEGLVAYCPMNERLASTVYDYANNHNGDIYGATWVQDTLLNSLRLLSEKEQTAFLDAASFDPDKGLVYFLKEGDYVAYDLANEKSYQSSGSIRELWSDLPNAFRYRVDSALFHYPDGKSYFFKGNQYAVYTPGSTRGVEEPLPIEGNWQGFPDDFAQGIDAAFFNQAENKAYFFKGDKYLRFDVQTAQVDPGYPKLIAGNWPGLSADFAKGIDATLYHEQDNKIYFFKADQYVSYTPGQGADLGFPRRIRPDWGMGDCESLSAHYVRFEPDAEDATAAVPVIEVPVKEEGETTYETPWNAGNYRVYVPLTHYIVLYDESGNSKKIVPTSFNMYIPLADTGIGNVSKITVHTRLVDERITVYSSLTEDYEGTDFDNPFVVFRNSVTFPTGTKAVKIWGSYPADIKILKAGEETPHTLSPDDPITIRFNNEGELPKLVISMRPTELISPRIEIQTDYMSEDSFFYIYPDEVFHNNIRDLDDPDAFWKNASALGINTDKVDQEDCRNLQASLQELLNSITISSAETENGVIKKRRLRTEELRSSLQNIHDAAQVTKAKQLAKKAKLENLKSNLTAGVEKLVEAKRKEEEKTWIEKAIDFIGDAIGDVFGGVQDLVESALDELENMPGMKEVLDGLKDALPDTIDGALGLLEKGLEGVQKGIEVLEQGLDEIDKVAQSAISALGEISPELASVAGAAWGAVRDVGKALLGAMSDVVGFAIDAVRMLRSLDEVLELHDFIVGFVEQGFTEIKKQLNGPVKAKGSEFLNSMRQMISDFTDEMQDLLDVEIKKPQENGEPSDSPISQAMEKLHWLLEKAGISNLVTSLAPSPEEFLDGEFAEILNRLMGAAETLTTSGIEAVSDVIQKSMSTLINNFGQIIAEPANAPKVILALFLEIIEIVANSTIDAFEKVWTAVCDALVAFVDLVRYFFTKEIYIPFISDLYEEISGRKLSLLSMIALASALPLAFLLTLLDQPVPDLSYKSATIFGPSQEKPYYVQKILYSFFRIFKGVFDGAIISVKGFVEGKKEKATIVASVFLDLFDAIFRFGDYKEAWGSESPQFGSSVDTALVRIDLFQAIADGVQGVIALTSLFRKRDNQVYVAESSNLTKPEVLGLIVHLLQSAGFAAQFLTNFAPASPNRPPRSKLGIAMNSMAYLNGLVQNAHGFADFLNQSSVESSLTNPKINLPIAGVVVSLGLAEGGIRIADWATSKP